VKVAGPRVERDEVVELVWQRAYCMLHVRQTKASSVDAAVKRMSSDWQNQSEEIEPKYQNGAPGNSGAAWLKDNTRAPETPGNDR
jgi:hypothetical protein